jgi:hypothetical protein
LTAQDDILGTILKEDEVLPLPLMVALNEFIEDHVPNHPVAIKKVLEAYDNLLEYIPRSHLISREQLQSEGHAGFKELTMSVPFYDILTKPGDAIFDFVVPFFDKEVRDAGIFEGLRKQLTDNENAASGITNVDRVLGRKNVVFVDKYKAEPPELIRIYLHGTPFFDFFNTQIEFRIPRKTFASHGIILAPPGHGKTQLLGSLISGALSEKNPVGCFVLDPHGDLFQVLSERVDPLRKVVLDPDRAPPALNFLDFGTSTEAQTLQTFSYLMSSLSGGLSDKQGAIVPYLLKLLRKIPGASLETLRTIVDEKVKSPEGSLFKSVIASLDTVDQGFFHNQFYNARMQETKDAIGWKLYSALSSDAFREMFSAKTNSFDADAAMRDRKVVLVKGARNNLGDEGMKVFLQFIVAQFFSAALRRERLPHSERHLCILFADEAHHIFNSQTSNILTECRKYGLGFIAATQVVQQIPDDVKAAIYGATAIKIAGPVSHTDAMILAREMYATGDFIRSMKAKEGSYADWAFYVSGMTDKAAKVRVPYGTLEAMPKLSTAQYMRPHISKIPEKNDIPQLSVIHTPKPGTPEYDDWMYQMIVRAEANKEAIEKELAAMPPDEEILDDDDDDEIPTSAPGGWKK